MEEISISKKVMPSLPDDYKETILGESRGSLKQFRSPSGMHAREYRDKFVVHQDKFDPRSDAVSHLALDSPETLIAFGTGLFVGRSVANFVSEKNPPPPPPISFAAGVVAFFFSFLSLRGMLRRLKRRIG